MKEKVVMLGREQDLVGIVTEPEDIANSTLPAVLLLNAGLIHRIGPNRLYVKLARRLAQLGHLVLRFDLSGVGDSRARTDTSSVEQRILEDVSQAMDYLTEAYGTQRFISMGHCAGAFISLWAAQQYPRVLGIVLINAEGGDDGWNDYDHKRKMSRYYQNYYTRGTLTDRQKWMKLLTGRANYASLFRNVFRDMLWNAVSARFFKLKRRVTGVHTAESAPQIAQMGTAMRALVEQRCSLLIIYSQGSSGLERTRLILGSDLRQLSASGYVEMKIIPQSDHTFTLLASQENLLHVIGSWCESLKQSVAAEAGR